MAGSDEAPGAKSLDWLAVARGALIGFVASLPFYVLIELLRHLFGGFADSGAESAFALLLLLGYVIAGYFAVSSRQAGTGTAALAGIGVACLGFAVSLVLWAVREGNLLTGNRADHPTLVLIGPIVAGALFGAFGGALGRRYRTFADAP